MGGGEDLFSVIASPTHTFLLSLFFFWIYLFIWAGGGGETEWREVAEKENLQADSPLSTETNEVRNFTTVRSRHELKPRFGRLIHWAPRPSCLPTPYPILLLLICLSTTDPWSLHYMPCTMRHVTCLIPRNPPDSLIREPHNSNLIPIFQMRKPRKARKG